MRDQNKILSGNDGKYPEKQQASPKQSTQNISNIPEDMSLFERILTKSFKGKP
jgi:hypothetical protein